MYCMLIPLLCVICPSTEKPPSPAAVSAQHSAFPDPASAAGHPHHRHQPCCPRPPPQQRQHHGGQCRGPGTHSCPGRYSTLTVIAVSTLTLPVTEISHSHTVTGPNIDDPWLWLPVEVLELIEHVLATVLLFKVDDTVILWYLLISGVNKCLF